MLKMKSSTVNFGGREIRLFQPKSEVGKLPNFTGNLPMLAEAEVGTSVAVGFNGAFAVYKFSWDAKKNRGTWNYVLTKFE
jgi:hypothetical protein